MRRPVALRARGVRRTLGGRGRPPVREGTGTLTGRLAGVATWSNSPRLRGDYAYPDSRGFITVASGGFVFFTLTGLSALSDGQGIHVLTFQTEDPDHLWLNTVLAIGEGAIDVERRVLAMRYYECIGTVLPAFE